MNKKIIAHGEDLKNKVENAAQDAVKVIAESADQASKTIASAAESATRLLASSAESATRLLASNASEALKASNAKNDGDHDILVVLKSKMEDLKSDIKDLKDNTTKRVDVLENTKLNITDSYAILYKKDMDKVQTDHETRIRANETNITRILTWGSVGLLFLSITEVLLFKISK